MAGCPTEHPAILSLDLGFQRLDFFEQKIDQRFKRTTQIFSGKKRRLNL